MEVASQLSPDRCQATYRRPVSSKLRLAKWRYRRLIVSIRTARSRDVLAARFCVCSLSAARDQYESVARRLQIVDWDARRHANSRNVAFIVDVYCYYHVQRGRGLLEWARR
jgi:hypothetical protein